MNRIRRLCALLLAALLLTSLLPAVSADSGTDCGAKLLALTFDDGPSIYTDGLLDELAARGVHATFFVNGVNASLYPDTLRRIVDEGHQLANHTYNHKELTSLSSDSIAREISAVQTLITEAGGDDPAYIRAPYGSINAAVRAAAPAPLINWSVDPVDWKYRNAATVRQNIVAGAHDGAIILCHDIHATSIPGALMAVDDLMAMGYEFVTVQELFYRRGVDPQPGVVYTSAPNNGVNLPAGQGGQGYFDETQLESHWGYAAMDFCMCRGWLEPDAEGRWLPDVWVTRQEFAAAFARFSGIQDLYPADLALQFTDVPADCVNAPYISWACGAGLIIGYPDSTFHPDDTLTREQMATILARYMQMRGVYAEGSVERYTDAARISGWAREGVGMCTELGLLQGAGGGRFNPLGRLTRAEIATILMRMAGE